MASDTQPFDAFELLEQGVFKALETYSNVHRGSGQKSLITTDLYEEARNVVLEYMDLNKKKFIVIFGSPRNVEKFTRNLRKSDYKVVTSEEIGLSLGVCALIVKSGFRPPGGFVHSGGGTAKLISKGWVIWAKPPARYEAGTPAIINIIAFARALQMVRLYGESIFRQPKAVALTANEILYEQEFENYIGAELLKNLRLKRIGAEIEISGLKDGRNLINLDNSASTPTFTPVWNAFRQTLRQPEVVKKEIIHKVKIICAAFVGVSLSDYEVIFTRNTTEAINLVAESLTALPVPGDRDMVVTSLLEHSSNDLPWRMIPNQTVIRLEVDQDGAIDLKQLEKILEENTGSRQTEGKRIRLVAISGASNVLGICTDIKAISRIVHDHGVELLVDAAQLVAHRKIDMAASGIDYLAFSAHKIYAPFGCGVLVSKKGLLGFDSEELGQIIASGEKNSAGIAALGSALSILHRIGMEIIEDEERELTSRTLSGLANVKGLKLLGIKDPASALFKSKIGVIPFTMKDAISFRVGKELAQKYGIGVRVGCHCAHILVKHILNVGPGLERFQRVMQTLVPVISFPGVVRVSLGLENSKEDIDILVQALNQIAAKEKSLQKNGEAKVTMEVPDVYFKMQASSKV